MSVFQVPTMLAVAAGSWRPEDFDLIDFTK